MHYKLSQASILDFPRKTLTKDLWVYETKEDLPKLKPGLRSKILEHAKKAMAPTGLKVDEVRLIGGAASYQWGPGTDIDVQIYAKWPEDVSEDRVLDLRKMVYKAKLDYEGYPITFYLKDPQDQPPDASEAEYDITDDEWALPPLILPQGFDPDEYFAPLMRVAENKAQKFDSTIGQLRRAWYAMKKASQAKDKARDRHIVDKNLQELKRDITDIIEKLTRSFERLRESRRELHDKLRARIAQDRNIGRFERFQEPEIVWKYLDRSGYIDYFTKLNELVNDNKLDGILARY